MSAIQNRIFLGLCCINTELRKKNIFCSRTMIRKNFTVEKAQKMALQNIADISKLAEWNYQHNIFVLRISSDIFPHFTDDETEPYDMTFAMEALKKAGEDLKTYKQRATFHPGQFNQVGAKSEDVFQKTCKDLKMHADMLDAMDVGTDGILCVHGGGVYDDKDETIQRWISNFERLPENVKSRLCIENCERCYSVNDCLRIAEACNIPLIFDTHHFECHNLINANAKNKKDKKDPILIEDVLDRVVATWKRRSITPMFHISEQREDARIGAHSDFIETIPDYILSIPEKYDTNITIDIEAKLKEQAILRLYQKYPYLNKPLSI